MKDLEKVLKAKAEKALSMQSEVDIKADKDLMKKRVIPMLKAQEKAEKDGENMFTCTICGGVANWARSTYNNHLHIYCSGCGFKMME